MQRTTLNDHCWSVRAIGDVSLVPDHIRGRSFPARVPGCVHLDLLRAGVIADPAMAQNEATVQWIGETDWEYRCSVELESAALVHDRLDLVCEGLDTIAELSLNGVTVGTARNAHHPHRFDLRAAARAGSNELVIVFRSPLRHIRDEAARLGPRPVNGDWEPYVFCRHAACSFGWDWAPKLATCGIHGPMSMEAWSNVRIASVRVAPRRSRHGLWQMRAVTTLEWASELGHKHDVWLNAALNNYQMDDDTIVDECDMIPARFPQTEYAVVLEPPPRRVELWEPAGMGLPSLYELEIEVRPEGADRPADLWTRKVGFRHVELDTKPDDHGSRFVVKVNGKEVFCKGANWIPEGLYAGHADAETVRARVRQAAGAGFNMLRVWGGGVYEQEAFYEACDELGILVWQDFMFACAMYPEEEPYPALIEAEARHQVARLSVHPSVVLWCGGNECTWAHESWGNAPGERPWKERLEGKTWGHGYYFEMLPRVVRELAPGTPYWPNSPWPGREGLDGNSYDHGDRHTWDEKVDGYTRGVARFVSEFGHQSPANLETLRESGTLEQLEHRQRATGGSARHIHESLAAWFAPARGFEEWHYLAQLMQARAVRLGFEWARVNQPRCMGALVWQLNDCWAGYSWSLIDSAGRQKPAYYAAQAACRGVLLTVQPLDGVARVCCVNDGEERVEDVVRVRRMEFDGRVLAETEVRLGAQRGVAGSTPLRELVGEPGDGAGEVVVAEGFAQRALWFYAVDKELRYPEARWSVERADDRVVLTAQTLIRDLRLGAALVTLLAGERVVATDAAADAVVQGPLLCANMFGASRVSQAR